MRRRDLLRLSTGASAAVVTQSRLKGGGHESAEFKTLAGGPIRPLANEFVTLWQSPPDTRGLAGTPGMTIVPNGRLVATFQVNSASEYQHSDQWGDWRGRVMISDDRGRSWRNAGEHPMSGARPIAVGNQLYIVGHNAGVCVIRSDNGGTSWSEPIRIRSDEPWQWYSQACSVVHTRERVYFTMDYITTQEGPPSRGNYAPVVMSAGVDADWLRPESWTFSSVLTFNQALGDYGLEHLPGVPFYPPNQHLDERRLGRIIQQPGWFESNMVQIVDPEHIWFDPTGRTFHILMRSVTGGLVNLAALAKAVHRADGEIEVSLERSPAGSPLLFLSMPGGHNRFHITYDPPSKLYWLVSLQTTDSMRRVELLNPKRWNLPDNERHRLALHFSKNCVDWCFAGMIAQVDDDGQSRHYGPGVVEGDDLLVLSRSASAVAENAHSADMLTFHAVRDFRKLVY